MDPSWRWTPLGSGPILGVGKSPLKSGPPSGVDPSWGDQSLFKVMWSILANQSLRHWGDWSAYMKSPLLWAEWGHSWGNWYLLQVIWSSCYQSLWTGRVLLLWADRGLILGPLNRDQSLLKVMWSICLKTGREPVPHEGSALTLIILAQISQMRHNSRTSC